MLSYASALIIKGSQFFGITDEEAWKVGNRHLPGTGSLIASIERVTLSQGNVIGRINPEAISLILKANSLKSEKCLLVGNKLETDILFGKNAGIHTCLVSQLNTSPLKNHKEEDEKKSDMILPNYICNEFSL